jgi:hypothetical protein
MRSLHLECQLAYCPATHPLTVSTREPTAFAMLLWFIPRLANSIARFRRSRVALVLQASEQ